MSWFFKKMPIAAAAPIMVPRGDVLLALAEEGRFRCKSRLLEAAKRDSPAMR